MVVRCSRCMGFKKSYKIPFKKCERRRTGQRGHGIKSFFKKVIKLAQKAVNSNIAKMPINQGLAYAPKLYNIGTSKIGNKKVKKLLQSQMAKKPLKQRTT